MTKKAVLVTGFEPYGRATINPSTEIVKLLNDTEIDGVPVVASVLPVSFRGLQERVADVLREVDPVLILNLGLWPGESMIRLERVALNLADFEIPDNSGELVQDSPIDLEAPVAIPSRLPLRAIETALLEAGIPARMSSTAGGFLCNATMYTFLRQHAFVPAGFVHLPYLPGQVAALLQSAKEERSLEQHQRSDYASMDLSTMLRAINVILTVSMRVKPGEETWSKTATLLSSW